MSRAGIIGLVFTAAVFSSHLVRADVVTDWNTVVLDTIRATRENPPRATRALAMVHVAIYDAINGIERVYEPYHVNRPVPPGASAEAAAAVAAHVVLLDLYPARKKVLDAALHRSLLAVPNGPNKNKGRAWGQFCGNEILRLRKQDGADVEVIYEPSGEFGHWQPTPPNFAPALLPHWPYVTPFAMLFGDQFRLAPPPEFNSLEYTAAFLEVKAMGAWDSELRTADETQIAFFWEDGAGTVTPPGHWQVIAQQLAVRFENSMLDNARLFALLSITQADAAIACWDTKYFYNHPRPFTGITLEADDDGNPLTETDPDWDSLIPTPPFPAYTSGHSTFSGSSAELLALFFGDDQIAFSGESPDPLRWPNALPGVVRSWDSLWEAAEEAGMSRIYGGIHWQYDNTEGLKCGRDLARYVFEFTCRPRD